MTPAACFLPDWLEKGPIRVRRLTRKLAQVRYGGLHADWSVQPRGQRDSTTGVFLAYHASHTPNEAPSLTDYSRLGTALPSGFTLSVNEFDWKS